MPFIPDSKPKGRFVPDSKEDRSQYSPWDNAINSSGMNFSPAGLINTGVKAVQAGAKKLGEFGTEDLKRRGYPSPIPQIVGGVVKYSPDILMMMAPPAEANAAKEVPALARSLGSRALGAQKRFLMTPFAEGKAAQAAEVALQNDVIPLSGNPITAMKNANALASKSGSKLGEIRESVGPQPIDNFINALDEYKAKRLAGAKGGVWDKIAGKIEEAKDTIKGIVAKDTVSATPEKTIDTGILNASGKPVLRTIAAKPGYTPPTSLEKIALAKKELSDTVNWMADNASQKEAKTLNKVIERASEKTLAEAGGDLKGYKGAKRIYGAAQQMKKTLQNEVAGQKGNIIPSVTGTVAAAGQLAAGNPLAAAAELGAVELLKRRGAGMAARGITDLANTLPKAVVPLANISSRAIGKPLTEEKIKEFLKKAGNDKKKARQDAIDAGYDPTLPLSK